MLHGEGIPLVSGDTVALDDDDNDDDHNLQAGTENGLSKRGILQQKTKITTPPMLRCVGLDTTRKRTGITEVLRRNIIRYTYPDSSDVLLCLYCELLRVSLRSLRVNPCA